MVIRSSWPGSVSGWQHSHITQSSPGATGAVTTGSFTATRSSPGSTTCWRPDARDSTVEAVSESTDQCFEAYVAHER